MDLTAAQDVAARRQRVWDAVADPEVLIERLRIRSLTLDGGMAAPAIVPGAEWAAVLDVKGTPRHGLLRVTEVMAPERLSMDGDFDGVSMSLRVRIIETAPQTCRVDLEVGAKARGIGGRMLLQSLRLMRPALEAKLAERLAQCARDIETAAV